ncbi:hypothetical protein Vadar_005637 [Vaccinium darrowii]|uniref:Uncharacterized protein n=1 Tax=Vaccinium darrowii TaxID=229202 RepID=A0ACB7XNS3_9ERIC|nr:hypothetical protein Vadar_005637 [Vaccinium darrowii]
MKISSKSILSPNHHRDPSAPVSLPPSLSRRLKTNRSLRGAQSPMFPTAGKKLPRSAFDNPEPSSPKVTCIGQVRVKSKKKQGIKKQGVRTGEVSFRKIESGNNPNQKWVHLPLTICEALRGIGSEISCLIPCRPRCFSTGGTPREREGEGKGNGGDSSCAAVIGRWLVGVQEGRGIELVVGGEEREAEEGEREIGDGQCEEVVEERRVSICVPPKNALLLMRCRSDPIRVSALVNRLWESPTRNAEEIEVEDEDGENEDVDGERLTEEKEDEVFEEFVLTEKKEEEKKNLEAEAEERETPEEELEINEEFDEEEEGEEEDDELEAVVEDDEVKVSAEAEENEVSCSVSEALSDSQRFENEENLVEDFQLMEFQREEIMRSDEELFLGFREMFFEEEDEEETEESSMAEKETQLEEEEEERLESEETQMELEVPETEEREREGNGDLEREKTEEVKKEQQNRASVLPECLLLMMCEPKLSMEVSKETWVCGGDFIRWQPERRKPVKRIDGCDGPRKRVSVDSSPAAPAAMSMAALIEQKLVNAVAYEPFVLTRCKSEPMRTAAAKLAPETCFWKNYRKLEPHRRATFGVGAAGVGF